MTGASRFPLLLATLLDALEAELLAAPDEEVQDALHLTGRARDAACGEVRLLLDEAKAAGEEGIARAGPHDGPEAAPRPDPELRRH